MSLLDALIEKTLARARELQRVPGSTYRVQLHAGFTFKDAAAIVPYLHALGITHLYCSPYLKAVPGSTHGYDVIDHSQLNPELGAVEDYEQLVAVLGAHGMSHILDSVPNHMGIATNENAWWNAVLADGRRSRYGQYFDIAWDLSPRPYLKDKVLLPVLGVPYAKALENRELKLKEENGKYYVSYSERRFPLSGDPPRGDDPEELDRVLTRQHYRLAYWRTAADEINYRRFFDINDLAALKMEREEVFRDAHAFTLKLLATGKLGGLRIDHPDGLYDPAAYFQRLQVHYLCALAEQVAAEEFASLGLEKVEAALQQHAQLLRVVVQCKRLHDVQRHILHQPEFRHCWGKHNIGN